MNPLFGLTGPLQPAKFRKRLPSAKRRLARLADLERIRLHNGRSGHRETLFQEALPVLLAVPLPGRAEGETTVAMLPAVAVEAEGSWFNREAKVVIALFFRIFGLGRSVHAIVK